MRFLLDPEGVKARVRLKSQVDPESGCWLWTGAKNSAGYGTLKVDGVALTAHHASRLAFTGNDPAEGYIRACDGPRHCCNPDHWRERECWQPRAQQTPAARQKASEKAHAFWSTQSDEQKRARTRAKRKALQDYRRRAVPKSWEQWDATNDGFPAVIYDRSRSKSGPYSLD